MQIRCVRVKLKPDSLERVREWQSVMNERRAEALETMQAEGMWVESTFLEETPEGPHLIVVLIAEDFDKARAVGRASTHAIDVYHREFRQAVADSHADLELLVDFNRFS